MTTATFFEGSEVQLLDEGCLWEEDQSCHGREECADELENCNLIRDISGSILASVVCEVKMRNGMLLTWKRVDIVTRRPEISASGIEILIGVSVGASFHGANTLVANSACAVNHCRPTVNCHATSGRTVHGQCIIGTAVVHKA